MTAGGINDGSDEGITLCGLDGSNPLGFLAAIGILQLLAAKGSCPAVTMSWSSDASTWNPVIHGVGREQKVVAESVAKELGCPFTPDKDADANRARCKKRVDEKKTSLKNAAEELKSRRLAGNERKAAVARELDPLRVELGQLRSEWLVALRRCIPSPELSLGEHLNATCGKLRADVLESLEDASITNREILDLYAAFGSDACALGKSDKMQPTTFCFTTGSGHQYFLDTVRQLYAKVDAQRLEGALFESSEPNDETLSMRWDPQEDRRYAVMWSDPGKVDKPKTNWARNLLAYRGLQSLPSVPQAKGLSTTGWLVDDNAAWNWPIWNGRIESNVVRSLLSHPAVLGADIDREATRALGVAAVYQCVRVQVGNPPLHKVNFTPARRIA